MAAVSYHEIMADREAAADFARYRSEIYRLASAVFTEDITAQMLLSQAQAAAEAREDSFVRDCERDLFGYLKGLPVADIEALRSKVATEYAELFVGPRSPLAPYYESIYLGANPRLFADVTMRVREAYREQGFQVEKRNKVPDDHIGYELAFMAELCDREARAHLAGEGEEALASQIAQSNFLSLHLGVWVGFFADRVCAAWCADYYAAWARFVEAFVADDIEFLRSCACDPVSGGGADGAE